jgi:surface protein
MTTLENSFSGASAFNQDISKWDVSRITSLAGTFKLATSFNQVSIKIQARLVPLYNNNNLTLITISTLILPFLQKDLLQWDVSRVTSLASTFSGATNFNKDISTWNVAAVTNMVYTFYTATYFDQDLRDWDVSNVNNMFGCFNSASNFNQNISNW